MQPLMLAMSDAMVTDICMTVIVCVALVCV